MICCLPIENHLSTAYSANDGYMMADDNTKDNKGKKGKVDKDSLKAAEFRADSLKKIAEYYAQFSDTTIVNMDDIVMISEDSYLQGFDSAVEKFDSGEYELALSKFQVYSETLPPSDSLYFETLFFISECYIALDNLNKAKNLLEELEVFGGVPDTVMEKVLVRIGQIWCVLDDELQAEAYFQMLRKKYPKSKYLPLANCSVVR